MRKTILAAVSAGALVLGAAACSSEEASDTAASATSAVGDAAEQATSGADEAGSDATSAAEDAGDGEGTDGTGTDGTGEAGADGAEGAEGAEGSEGADGEMVALPGAAGDVQVPKAIADKYQELGGEGGHLGAPQGEPQQVGDGTMVTFAGGAIAQKSGGEAHLVQGEILRHYTELGGPGGDLGFPTADEAEIDGGWESTFENGTIRFVNGEFEVS